MRWLLVISLALAAGDWDGDGDLDLAVANNGASRVDILENDGDGGFTIADQELFAGDR